MKSYLKLLAILFAFILQSSVISAATQELYEVELSSTSNKIDPTLGGTSGPSRAPARFTFSLSAYIDASSLQLYFYDSNSRTYTYSILNSEGDIVQGGILDFSFGDTFIVDVDFLLPGEYTLVVNQGSRSFSGSFVLN